MVSKGFVRCPFLSASQAQRAYFKYSTKNATVVSRSALSSTAAVAASSDR